MSHRRSSLGARAQGLSGRDAAHGHVAADSSMRVPICRVCNGRQRGRTVALARHPFTAFRAGSEPFAALRPQNDIVIGLPSPPPSAPPPRGTSLACFLMLSVEAQ